MALISLLGFNFSFANDFEEFANLEEIENNSDETKSDSDIIKEVLEAEISEEEKLFKIKIDDQFSFSKANIRQLNSNIADTEYHLSKIIQNKVDLEYQVDLLENAISSTEKNIQKLNESTIETEAEIKFLEEKINIGEIAFNYQRDLLKRYIEIFYVENKKFFSDDDVATAFRFLLSDKSVGENLRELQNLSLINETAYHILDSLEDISYDLDGEKRAYQDKNLELKLLLEGNILEKENLLEQSEAKRVFLASTKGQEQIYKQLLEQSRFEQDEAIEVVRLLNFAISDINREISETGTFDSKKYENLLNTNYSTISEFRKNYILNGGIAKFDWPVEPFKGLSAFFRDPGYAGFFGVRHNAIDIPAFQGTPVRSAGDGVVYKVKDNGYGYSYIIVAHADGFSTVYGHISKFMVEAGEIVSMGSIIGLSGGMPGTLGAGYMTTGPHLHFEMLKDGEYIDPLYFIPLYVLTAEQMDWLPEKYTEIWRQSVFDKSGGRIIRNEIFESSEDSESVELDLI